jgi:hypothetical protein
VAPPVPHAQLLVDIDSASRSPDRARRTQRAPDAAPFPQQPPRIVITIGQEHLGGGEQRLEIRVLLQVGRFARSNPAQRLLLNVVSARQVRLEHLQRRLRVERSDQYFL